MGLRVIGIWRAYLRVLSTEAALAELEAALGMPAHRGHSKGDARPQRTPHEWSAWHHPLWWRASRHGGTEGIDRAIHGLPAELADRVRARVVAGDAASLVVVQDMDGDDPTGSLGLTLSADAVAWLARAGMSLDVDQYADLVGEPDDVSPDYHPPLDFGSWVATMSASLRQYEAQFAEHYGYPVEPGSNIVTRSGTSVPWVPLEDLPRPLVRFYDVVGQASLMDVHIGYAIHPATTLVGDGKLAYPGRIDVDGTRIEVATFGSDGGGGLFAMVRDNGRVIHLPPSDVRDRTWFAHTAARPRDIAADLDTFLRHLLDVVDQLIETGDTRGI
jgi:hypothetical protein